MQRLIVTSIFLISAAVALAQDPPPPPDGGPRGPGGPGGRMGGRMNWVGPMFDRMSFELNLDETQTATLATLRDQMRENMRTQGEAMRERWEEVRAAREAGDEEKARKLADELRGNGGPWSGIDQVFDQLQPSLRPEQVTKLDAMRDRISNERDGWERNDRLRRELPDQLNLDDSQREQLRDMMRERMRSGWEERRGQMDSVMQEISDARDAGDNEKLAALYARMDELRPNPDAVAQDMLTQMEPILNDEQKQKLAEIREFSFGDGAADAKQAQSGPDVRAVLKAARRARLTAEQREQLRDIEKDAMGAYRQARNDKAAQAALAEQVHQKIAAILTPEQKPAFEQQLERAARKK